MGTNKDIIRTQSVEFQMLQSATKYGILRSDVPLTNRAVTRNTDRFMVPFSLKAGIHTYNETTLKIIQEKDSGAIAVFVFMMICTGRDMIKVGDIQTDRCPNINVKTSNVDNRVLNCLLTSVNTSLNSLSQNYRIKVPDADNEAVLNFFILTAQNTLIPSIYLNGFPKQRLKFIATTEIYTLD